MKIVENKEARNNLLTLHSDVPRCRSHTFVSTALKPGQAYTHVIGPISVKNPPCPQDQNKRRTSKSGKKWKIKINHTSSSVYFMPLRSTFVLSSEIPISSPPPKQPKSEESSSKETTGPGREGAVDVENERRWVEEKRWRRLGCGLREVLRIGFSCSGIAMGGEGVNRGRGFGLSMRLIHIHPISTAIFTPKAFLGFSLGAGFINYNSKK